MNEDFNSIIAQYREEGRDDDYIARKIFLSGDFSGQFADALNLVSSFKKKEEPETQAPSGSPEPIQEFAPITLASVSAGTPSGSSSQDPEPVSEQLETYSSLSEIGEEYQERFFNEKTEIIQGLLSEDAEFGAKVKEINESDKTDREKRYAIELEFKDRYSKKERDLRESYTEEIIGRLPEGTDLTQAATKLYNDYGLAIPLDGDRRYNEGVTGIGSAVTDIAVDLGAAFASIGSSLLSLSTIGFQGVDMATAIKNAAQKEIDEFKAASTTQYDQTFFEALSNGDIGEVITRSFRTAAESAPYFIPYLGATSRVVGGVSVGIMAGTDSYMRSRSEDLDRIKKGIDPVYDMDSASGELARIGGASIDAVLTGVAGGVQAKIAGRVLTEVARNPATTQTAVQMFKGYMKEQGVDVATEAVVEAIQEASNMVYQDIASGQDYTGEQYAERIVESLLLGGFSSAAIASPGAAFSGLRAGRELVTGPQAASKSRVERSGVEKDIESLNTSQDLSGFVDSYESDRRSDAAERESFYTMMAVRHPADMNRIKQLDLSLEQAVIEYRKAQADGADLGPAKTKIESIVKQRQSIVESYSNENTNLSSQESRLIEDSKIANKLEGLSDDVSVLSESVSVQEEYFGTEGFDQGAYTDAIQNRDAAIEKRKEALRLLGELAKARKETAEASRGAATEAADASALEEAVTAATKEYEAEQALRLHLGMDISPMGEIEAKPEQTQQYNASSQLEAHKSNGGSTFSLDGRDLIGQPKASVSIFPERSKIVEGREITEQDVIDYLEENKDILEGNEDVLAVGTWFDEGSGNTYIDISAVLDKDIAVNLGKQYNQKAVFDLEAIEEIDTGGSGETEVGLKPEAERIVDIRKFMAPEEAVVEEPKTEEVTPEPEPSDIRGIEGKFTEYTPKKDGSIGVIAKGPLLAKYARFINNKLASTFNENFGDKYKFVVHDTAESGDKADRVGQTQKLGHAVINPDGSVEVHINPSRFAEAKAAGKDPLAVLVEEVFHVTLSPSLAKLYRSNRPALDKLLSDMEGIARSTGNKDLINRVEAKKSAYEKAGAKEDAVIDEALAEYVAEMLNYEYSPTLMDRIRVMLNKILKASVGKDTFTITSLDSAEKIVSAFSAMVRDGSAVKVAESVVDNTTERSAISPSKLPEDQSFRVTWWQPRVFRSGAEAGLTGESTLKSQTFNGKWHFINWWKHATKMGQLNFTGFQAVIDGKEVDIDANIMRRWKMKPPVDRAAIEREQAKEKRRTIPKIISFVNKNRINQEKSQGVPYYLNQQNVGFDYRIVIDKFRDFATDEQVEQINEILSEANENRPFNHTKEYNQILQEVATYEDVSRLVEEMELEYEDQSGVDPIERSAVISFYKFSESESARDDFELKTDQKRKALCDVGSKTCSTNDKVSLLQYESYMVKQQIGDSPSMKESVRYAAQALDVAKNHLMLEGFDIKNVIKNYNDGKEVLYGRLDSDPDIKIDPRDFDGVYDLILSYTSNGSQLDPNITLANQLFSAGLLRMQSGSSEFISRDRIESIAKKESDGTLESVNGQRAGAMAGHLSDINDVVKQYLKDGKFDKNRFFNEMKKRDKNGVPLLAKTIGENTEKLADLTLGNMGDPDAIPMDSNFKDQYNIYRGKFSLTDFSEGLVIPTDVRIRVVEAMKNAGRDVNIGMSDPEIFDDIRSMKSSGDDALISKGKRFYAELTGNNLSALRDFTASDKRQSRGFVSAVAKEMNLTPFQVQQMMYMDGIYTWNLYRGKRFVSDYKSAQERNLQEDLSSMAIDRSSIFNPGDQLDMFSQEVPKEAKRFQTPGRRIVTESAPKIIEATENELYRERSVDQGSKVRVRGAEVVLTQKAVDEALNTDATSRRIIGKGVQISEGQKVGVRLNLNVMKNTGVPVQTMHDKTASGEALKYAPAVTVKNATLFVNQNARNKIVTFQENKFPMASVNGEFVDAGTELDYSGVRAVFNPFRHNVFVDMAGRPIKSAEEATIVGGNVYLRGKIEYYDMSDPVLASGRTETEQQRNKRIKRGDKYDKAINRFIGYSKSQGIEFGSRQEAEAAYDNMSIPSEVAIDESEVANNMGEAMERASIASFTKKGLRMRQTAAKAARKYTEARADIINNPSNYIAPQNLQEIKNRLQDLTDQELIDTMTDDAIGRLSQRNDDMGVLAGSELIRRAIARGEVDRVPAIIAELAAMGTTAGRILRHFRELKSSTPAGLEATINSSVEASGNKLSDAQKSELKQLTLDLFQQQSVVEDLMRRAVGGEEVDAELESSIKKLKTLERQLDTFANKNIEKGWGDLFGQLVQGNLLTTMSQVLNVGANMVNAVGNVAVSTISLPIEAAYVKVGNIMGKDLEMRRRPSLMAYMYAVRKFGEGFVESSDTFVTGQDRDISEWRVNRGLAPFRSLMAAINKDLPMGPDGKFSTSQRAKLFVQGTLGIPAETMFRMLSFGDIPFRRYAEGLYLYQTGLNMGLEGEALARFLKYPTREQLAKAQTEGRKLTFQEETVASRTTNQVISTLTDATAKALDAIPFVNGTAFAKGLFRAMVPFRSTPANILYETFTWVNPYVGIIRMANNISDGNTEEASKTLSKMMLGAVTMEAAMLMIKEGIISGAIQWDEDEERNIAYDVFPPSSINVSALKRLISGESPEKKKDDRFVKYDKLGMIGAVLATAVQSVDMSDVSDIKEEEYDGPIDFFTDAITGFFGLNSFSAISMMMEQSFVQGLNGFLKVLTGDDVERNAENLVNSLFQAGSAAVLPNQMSAFYRAEREFLPDTRTTKDMDAMERILKKFEYTIKDRTFGLADHPVRYNWKGEPITQTPRGANSIAYQLFDISKSRQGTADPLSNEIWRLYEQTEDLTELCGTPSYAAKRSLSVPDVKSKKELKAARMLGKEYSWMNDEEFMKGRVYLNVEQINRLMMVAGQARYKDAIEVIKGAKYQNATDEKKIEMLNEVAEKYASSKEYDGSRFMPHTVALFDILQEIYDSER